KRGETGLITSLFLCYMEPVCYVSRGKSGEADTGKRDYRHRLRIPRNSATQSVGKLPPSPQESCHIVHRKVATQSTGILPPVARQVAPLSERRDAGVFMISLIRLLLSTVVR